MDKIEISPIENGWLVRCMNDFTYPPKDYYCVDIQEINRRVEEFLFRPADDDDLDAEIENLFF